MSRDGRRQPGIRAKYSGTCARCHLIYNVGDRIVRRGGSYIHVSCASGADDE